MGMCGTPEALRNRPSHTPCRLPLGTETTMNRISLMSLASALSLLALWGCETQTRSTPSRLEQAAAPSGAAPLALESTDLARVLPMDRGAGSAVKPIPPAHSSLVAFLASSGTLDTEGARRFIRDIYALSLSEEPAGTSAFADVNAFAQETKMGLAEFETWYPVDYWTLVSFRLDPCAIVAPLPPAFLDRPLPSGSGKTFGDALCVPQVRLAAQPMLGNVLLPDGKRGTDVDQMTIHLTFDLVDFHRQVVSELEGRATIVDEDVLALVEMHQRHEADVIAAQRALRDAAGRLAKEASLRVMARGSSFLDVSNSHSVEAPKNEYLKEVVSLLASLARGQTLAGVKFAFNSRDRGGSVYGAASVLRNQQGTLQIVPTTIAPRTYVENEGAKRLFDLGRFENAFVSRLSAFLDFNTGAYNANGLDAGLTTAMKALPPESPFVRKSSFQDLLRPEASDEDVFATLSNQILPSVNNRHSTTCVTCHQSEEGVFFVVGARKWIKDIDTRLQFSYGELDAFLETIPAGRMGQTGVFRLDRERSLDREPFLQANEILSTSSGLGFGYLAETPMSSMRNFVEVSIQTDLFNRLRL